MPSSHPWSDDSVLNLVKNDIYMYNIYSEIKSVKLLSYTIENQFYCLSKKSSPILYSNLLYKTGQDLLDIQYQVSRTN